MFICYFCRGIFMNADVSIRIVSGLAQGSLSNSSLLEANHVNNLRDEVKGRTPPASKTFKSVEDMKKAIGTEVGVSGWLEITQERVNTFADATCDWQWIHTDPERAKRESPFGGPVAHGFLTLSLAPFLNAEAVPRLEGVKMGVNYGLNKVRFVSPVHVGSKVRTRVTLKEVTEVPGGIQVVIEGVFEVQEKGKSEPAKKPVAIAEQIARYYL